MKSTEVLQRHIAVTVGIKAAASSTDSTSGTEQAGVKGGVVGRPLESRDWLLVKDPRMTAALLTPHPDFARFRRTMKRLVVDKRFVSWQGDVYRLAHPKYASADDFLSGEGARLKGARWNPPRGPCTLYASSSPELAAEEAFALARKFGFAPRQLLPRAIKAFHVRVSLLVDTTDGDIRRSLMVSKQRMLDTDWRKANARGKEALTQAIGRAAAETGLEGLIAASAERQDETNLVLFTGNLGSKSRIEVVS